VSATRRKVCSMRLWKHFDNQLLNRSPICVPFFGQIALPAFSLIFNNYSLSSTEFTQKSVVFSALIVSDNA